MFVLFQKNFFYRLVQLKSSKLSILAIFSKYLLLIVLFNYVSINSSEKPSNKALFEVVNDDPDDISAEPLNGNNINDGTEMGFAQTVNGRTHQLVPPYVEIPIDYRRVCIYPNWSVLRDSNMAKIFPEDIPADLCTHIHYAYANIDVRTLQLSPSQYQDFNTGDHGAPLYERIMKLRQTNPNLKILISIGGWFAKSTPFNHILVSNTTRNTFIQNVLNFLRVWKFDGLDIQWEYPGDVEYGATPDSKQRYTSLIKHLFKAFKDEYNANFKKYILTAFVPADESRIDAGYQVKSICKYLDYISVATYDYTGPYDSKTGYNSPLYSRNQIQNSVNNSIYYWLQRGCPAKKLLVGISTYGRAFKIIKRSNSPNLLFVGIESEPFVNPSIYTSEEGILSYYEVCEMMSNKESRVYWDDLAEVPFAIVSSNQSNSENSASNLWISYEDARSVRKKVEYVKKMSLGGVSVWSLDMDDFKGWFCNLGSYPIIESIKEEFEHKIKLVEEENSIDETPPIPEPMTTIEIDDTTKSMSSSLSTQRRTNKPKTTTSPDTEDESKQEPDVESFDNFISKLKRFKAVREIKLIACLDSQKCALKNSSLLIQNVFTLNIIFYISFQIILYLLV